MHKRAAERVAWLVAVGLCVGGRSLTFAQAGAGVEAGAGTTTSTSTSTGTSTSTEGGAGTQTGTGAVTGAGAETEMRQGSLTLAQAVGMAVSRAESARAADQRVIAAEARVDKAGSMFYPDLTLTGTYTRRLQSTRVMGKLIQDENALGTQLSLEVALFDGRAFPLLRQAKLDRDAQKLEARDDKRRIAFDTASAFLATMGQERVVKAAGSRVELARKNLSDARYRVEAGFIGSNELTRVELEAAAAERDYTTAVATLRRARLQLGYLIDTDINEMLVVPIAFYKEAFYGDIPSSSEQPRLDVVAQTKRAEALEAGAEEPMYRMLPRAALIATGRATNEGGFAGRELDGNLGVTLTWTLFDGGERYADKDEREALAAAQRLTAEETARLAKTEVQSAIVVLERGRAGLKEAERVAEIARRNAAETSELFRQGLVTSLAVTDATVSLFDAEVELSTARYDTGIGLLELRLALGQDPFGKEPAP